VTRRNHTELFIRDATPPSDDQHSKSSLVSSEPGSIDATPLSGSDDLPASMLSEIMPGNDDDLPGGNDDLPGDDDDLPPIGTDLQEVHPSFSIKFPWVDISVFHGSGGEIIACHLFDVLLRTESRPRSETPGSADVGMPGFIELALSVGRVQVDDLGLAKTDEPGFVALRRSTSGGTPS